MNVTPAMLLTLCPLIFLASLIDAIGGGGGLISLPAYLLTGIPAQMASGSNKCSACFGTLLATARYARSGKLNWKPGLAAVLGALPGSWLGAQVQMLLPEATVRLFMLIALPVVAALLLIKRNEPEHTREITRRTLVYCALIGLGCGFYDGFFGPGTGTILIMLFTWIAGMDMVSASGTAKLVNLASNASALALFLVNGQVVFALALPATVCSIAGGYVGAALAVRIGSRLIRIVMIVVLVALIVKLALQFAGIG